MQVKVEHRGFVSVEPHASPSAIHEDILISGGNKGSTGWILAATAPLIGPHQHSNIAAAVTAALQLRSMGWAMEDEHIAAGIKRAFLPGRFQVCCLLGLTACVHAFLHNTCVGPRHAVQTAIGFAAPAISGAACAEKG